MTGYMLYSGVAFVGVILAGLLISTIYSHPILIPTLFIICCVMFQVLSIITNEVEKNGCGCFDCNPLLTSGILMMAASFFSLAMMLVMYGWDVIL